MPTLLLKSTRLSVGSEMVLHYEYFHTVLVPQFKGYFSVYLWEGLILQAAASEPSIQSAVTALGALARSQSLSDAGTADLMSRLAARQYTSALKALSGKPEMEDDIYSHKVAVIAGLLFMIFEVLRADEMTALLHLEHTTAVLQNLCREYVARNLGQVFRGCLDVGTASWAGESMLRHDLAINDDVGELTAAFSRLGNQVATYSARYEAVHFETPRIPFAFTEVPEARAALDAISALMYSTLDFKSERLRTLPTTDLPVSLGRQIQGIETLFSCWSTAFQRFITNYNSRPQARTSDTMTSIDVLLIQQITATIILATHFYQDELCYDDHYLRFARLVNLSRIVIDSRLATQSSPENLGVFSVDTAIVFPLYFTATKCRYPSLRREALHLLAQAGREGVYDGRKFSHVARWIIGHEERYLDSNQSRDVHSASVSGEERIRRFVLSPSRLEQGFVHVLCGKRVGYGGEWRYFGDTVRDYEDGDKNGEGDAKTLEKKGELWADIGRYEIWHQGFV